MSIFKDKVLLITGGTGSFGNAVLRRFLDSDIREIRIFSRDEKKQDDMRHFLQANRPDVSNKVKFYIGNVRNREAIDFAMNGVDYVFSAAALTSVFRQMSVEDNIASVLEMTDKPLEYQKDKLESLIAEFRLQKVRKNKGNQLSGGERRRTEIARCLAIDPKFIMLDEPFAGVDPIAVEDIQQIVWKLKDRNIGILITDHNVQETLSITDRAYLLFEGKIL